MNRTEAQRALEHAVEEKDRALAEFRRCAAEWREAVAGYNAACETVREAEATLAACPPDSVPTPEPRRRKRNT